MNWNHELIASCKWLAIAFPSSIIGVIIATWIFARRSRWGRQIWRLAWPYFDPRRSWRPLADLAFVLLLTLMAVRINVLFSYWYNDFYTALQKIDAKLVWFSISLFGVLATAHVLRALIAYYARQALGVHWRVWLNDRLVRRWLGHQVYYRSEHLATAIDNPDQRIQQDVNSFTTSSIDLSMGLVSSMVSIIAFTQILWNLSGPFTVLDFTIPRAMVYMVYVYVIVASVFAFKIGRPLIDLSFRNEQLNATYRYGLIRVREYGESIAFYRGESVEEAGLDTRFRRVIDNVWSIIHRTLKFSGFNLTISQISVVFPFIVQLPRFLAKQIELGAVMQTANAFSQVQDALSFFRESYDTFAGYRATINRLTGFLDAAEAAEALPSPRIRSEGTRVAVTDLSVRSPEGKVLVSALTLDIDAHQPLLIRGRSGIGKTTLLRAIAGLWPFADGEVVRPDGADCLFVAQKPYLPLGTLRQALSYPLPAQSDDRTTTILKQCRLESLCARLDEDNDWSRILSLGEQQRLAFGRALLNQPAAIFLDEATSAMDEELEVAMYNLLREQVPHAVIVSIGHRSTLRPFHRFELNLIDGGHRLAAL